MKALAIRREARRRARDAHIAHLEGDNGFTPSVDPSGLPHVVVVRDPTGDWFFANRWISRGFDDDRYGSTFYEVKSATRRGCIRKARKRMRALVERDLVGETEVTV